MSLKQNRIIKIVMEFVKAGTSYDITGIDLGLAKFFYREPQMLFQNLAVGDYTISTGGGKQTLTITNPELLAKIEAFQVAYVLDFDASKYDTQWNVDINTLKDKYNQLLDVTFNVWEYVRKIGFVADDTAMQIILPQLNTGEVWVKTDIGWRGLNVGDIESNIKAFWIEFNKKTQEILEQIVAAGKVQEGLLEDFTQQKIKEINEEGLKLEVTQVGHGFIFNAVQFDKTTGAYTKADVNTGADGIAVRIDDDRFYLSSNGIIEIPANAVDSKGNPYELDEYYFLDNEVAGGCTPEKPIHIFQALFCVVNKKGVKSALIEIGDPIDLNPRILVDEINSLGLATTDQVVLSEPTIADLIASKKYKVGDVVEVLGYYEKGDGAGHQRQKRPIGYNGADAVIGADGSIWGIVMENNTTSITHWGCRANDGFDNTDILQSIFDFCQGRTSFSNYNTLKVIVPIGMFKISRTLMITPRITLEGVVTTNARALDFAYQTTSCIVADVNFKGLHMFDSANERVSDGVRNIGLFPEMADIFGGWKPRVYKPSGDIKFKNLVFLCSRVCGAFNLWGANMCCIEDNLIKEALLPSNISCSWGHNVVNNTFDSLFAGIMFKHITYGNFDNNYFTMDVKGTTYDVVKTKLWGEYNAQKLTSLGGVAGAQIGSCVYFVNSSMSVGATYFESHECGISIYSIPTQIDGTSSIYEAVAPTFNSMIAYEELGIGFQIRSDLDIDMRGAIYYKVGKLAQLYADNDVKISVSTSVKPVYPNITNIPVEWLHLKSQRTYFNFNADEGIVIQENSNIRKNSPITIGDNLLAFKNFITDKRFDEYSTLSGYQSKFGFFTKLDSAGIQVYNGFGGNGVGSFALFNYGDNLAFVMKNLDGSISGTRVISTITVKTLDTPYHAAQMSKLGILDSYHNYLTELHEYEKSQNTQSDSEIMALNVLQPPVIPTEVEEYAKEYNLI